MGRAFSCDDRKIPHRALTPRRVSPSASYLTTPPFPYPRSQVPEPIGLPVLFDGELTTEDRRNLHYGEVGLEGRDLVTSGIYGWTMVVTGVGPSIAVAQERANRLADRVLVPNVRYRHDIGSRLMRGDYARVEQLGLLDPTSGKWVPRSSSNMLREKRERAFSRLPAGLRVIARRSVFVVEAVLGAVIKIDRHRRVRRPERPRFAPTARSCPDRRYAQSPDSAAVRRRSRASSSRNRRPSTHSRGGRPRAKRANRPSRTRPGPPCPRSRRHRVRHRDRQAHCSRFQLL